MALLYFTYRVYFLNEILLQGTSDMIYLVTLLLVFSLVAYLFVRSKKEESFDISLEEQHHFLRTISEYTSTADVILDEKNKIRFVNSNFKGLFKAGKDELPGQYLYETALPEEIKHVIGKHEGAGTQTARYNDSELEISSSLITDYQGRFIGKYVRVKTEEKLEGESDLSHDLKTPLHAIKGFSSLLYKKEELSNEDKKLFRLISENSELLSNRIDKLLGGKRNDDIPESVPAVDDFDIEKILIVDDVAINRKLLKMILKQHNFSVLEAEDGESAVKLVTGELPDIILMDISMPGIDGIEAVRLIREMGGKFKNVPIIAVTASLLYDKKTLVEKGFNDLLNKPFREEHLIQLIGSTRPARSA